ncbi:MAG TPA: phosphatase PAP2 family protein [bacterium]|nr:phosphatase PAP2 family protein [bacterium]
MKLLRLRKADALPLALAGAYFLSIHWTMGLRPEHLLLAGFLVGCYFLHEKSRRFVLDFLPIAFFGILYDFLRIYPKAWAGPIHVQWPFELERALFGIPSGGDRVIPSFFLQDHHAAFLDVVTGLTYSLHMVIPIGFAFYAWIRNREFARRFNWTFFIVNLLAFATYIALPVAPPWYVQAFGFQPGDWSVAPQAAGLVHFDALIGHPYFEGVYAKNAWVFGAIPSMHAGFPFLVVWYARTILKKGLIPLVFFMLLVWFSAVYLAHHYVIDLIAGVFYVCVAILIHRLLCPNKRKASSHASSA